MTSDRDDVRKPRRGTAAPGRAAAATTGHTATAVPSLSPAVADRSRSIGVVWSSPLAPTGLGLLPRATAGRGPPRRGSRAGTFGGEAAPPRGLEDSPQTLSSTGASHLSGLRSSRMAEPMVSVRAFGSSRPAPAGEGFAALGDCAPGWPRDLDVCRAPRSGRCPLAFRPTWSGPNTNSLSKHSATQSMEHSVVGERALRGLWLDTPWNHSASKCGGGCSTAPRIFPTMACASGRRNS
mmetsp:Transcript_49420/g.132240  ORF Transcript_49420/g.132240 Transcript_49420/m.132240 type:complete len:237 (-) Transcript_49420:1002-1712(-)